MQSVQKKVFPSSTLVKMQSLLIFLTRWKRSKRLLQCSNSPFAQHPPFWGRKAHQGAPPLPFVGVWHPHPSPMSSAAGSCGSSSSRSEALGVPVGGLGPRMERKGTVAAAEKRGGGATPGEIWRGACWGIERRCNDGCNAKTAWGFNEKRSWMV